MDDKPYLPPMRPIQLNNSYSNELENLKALLAACSKVIAYYTVRYDEYGTFDEDYLNHKEKLQELSFMLRKIYDTYGELDEDVQEHSTDLNFHQSMTIIEKLLGE